VFIPIETTTSKSNPTATVAAKQVNKSIQELDLGVGTGMSFARKQPQSFNGQAMNAKKLDIDFGGDDFFNTFSPGVKE